MKTSDSSVVVNSSCRRETWKKGTPYSIVSNVVNVAEMIIITKGFASEPRMRKARKRESIHQSTYKKQTQRNEL